MQMLAASVRLQRYSCTERWAEPRSSTNWTRHSGEGGPLRRVDTPAWLARRKETALFDRPPRRWGYLRLDPYEHSGNGLVRIEVTATTDRLEYPRLLLA